MFKKLLAPLDGSEDAERALPWVKRYAAPSKAMTVLVRAVARSAGGPPLRVVRQEAEDYLLRIERELHYAGVPAKRIVREGPAPGVIAREAAAEGCDLIVMTTQGKAPLGLRRAEGVTARATRLSSVPVLVVRGRIPPPRQGHVRRIVVPLDGSAAAEAILPWAESLARRHKSSLLLLHVLARGAPEAKILRRSESRARVLRGRGVRAAVRVERGDPADEILRAGDADDLIALTTHGHGGFKRWIFGSVAEQVCLNARIPVFVYRAAAPGARRNRPPA